jgi:hypothetical protein
MDKPHTGQVVRANLGRIVAAAEKRERKCRARANTLNPPLERGTL